jgi:hypothetical protein
MCGTKVLKIESICSSHIPWAIEYRAKGAAGKKISRLAAGKVWQLEQGSASVKNKHQAVTFFDRVTFLSRRIGNVPLRWNFRAPPVRVINPIVEGASNTIANHLTSA